MKQRVLFVNDEMVMGGVARILITMLNKIDPNKFDVDVLILHPHGELMSELPTWVNILEGTNFFSAVDVNLRQSLANHEWSKVLSKLKLLRLMKFGGIEQELLKQRKLLKLDVKPYDVEMAAKEGFCTLFVSLGKAKRKLNWIHVDYSAQNYSVHHMGLMKKAIAKMDLNVAVSLKAAKAYKDLFDAQNTITINNPIDVKGLTRKTQDTCDFKFDQADVNLISVARFHPQKAVDRLIDAFSQIKQTNVKLYLIGSGNLEKDLKEHVKTLNLENKVIFLGLKSNPMPFIKQADLFVLSSLYEGYPTTVIESLIAGTPVLSTNVSGVHEQLIENETGWIVENSTNALATKLIELVSDKEKLRNIKANLKNYTYSNEKIVEAFEEALLGLQK